MNKFILLFKKKLIPEVNTFFEAESYCNSKMPLGYQSKLLCEYRFSKLDLFLKNGGSLIKGSSINTLLICISYFLNLNNGKFPNFIDFGGACGENILFLESIFGKSINKISYVVETNAQIVEANKWNFVRNVKFENNLDKVLEHNIDLFFTSCALNYIEDPYEILKKVVNKLIPCVCLTRNNFSIHPKPFIQVSNLSENGLGEHINDYGNPLIWYPSQTLCEKTIKEIFLSSNYKLIFEDDLVNSGVLNSNSNYSKDLIFHLKD
tara:strand:- start:40 stop:831 length:792 start_codon:yes stop_codon:yes gene_type:complete